MPESETSLPEPGEFDIIRSVFRPLAAGQPGAFELTDDAACLMPPPGHEIVLTADAIVAGVHFLVDDPAEDVAVKLLGVNLSDLAAMGAEPLGYLITTAWPRPLDLAWIEGFGRGLAAAQDAFGIGLLGGDTVATNGPMTLSLTAIGSLPRGQALRRAGARPGDRICVSGTIGDAAAGLALLQGRLSDNDATRREFLIGRYRRPLPRLALGLALRGLATACIDVSDGLLADLGHILETSAVGAEIDLAAVPLSAADAGREDRLAAIAGGDDYELLFTVPADRLDELAAAANRGGVALHAIGRIVTGSGIVVRDEDGGPVTTERSGYRHF